MLDPVSYVRPRCGIDAAKLKLTGGRAEPGLNLDEQGLYEGFVSQLLNGLLPR